LAGVAGAAGIEPSSCIDKDLPSESPDACGANSLQSGQGRSQATLFFFENARMSLVLRLHFGRGVFDARSRMACRPRNIVKVNARDESGPRQ